MTQFRRGYAEGPFGQVHFQETGGDGPVVMLSHQSPQSCRQFDIVMPYLRRAGVRAIAVDHPGFGMSDPTPDIPTIGDYAEVFPAVMDLLGIDEADFVGHHTGAQVITEVALRHPGRVRKLVLNGPSPFSQEELANLRDYVDREERNLVYDEDGGHLARGFQRRWALFGPGGDPKLTTRIVAEKFIGLGPFWWGHQAAFSYDHADSLIRLRHPALILTNTGDMIYEAAQRARQLRPDFDYVELAGGGIDLTDQQPQAWTDAVMRFLRAS